MLGTVFVVIFFAARIISNQFRASIIETIESRDNALLEDISTTITNISNNEYKKLTTLKSVVESTFSSNYSDNENLYRSIVKKLCDNNPMVAFAWLSFDNGSITGISDGRHLIRSENTSYGIETKSSIIDYDSDNLSDPFYPAFKNNAAVLTEPVSFLQDGSTTKKYLKVSITMPIEHNGKTIGTISSLSAPAARVSR